MTEGIMNLTIYIKDQLWKLKVSEFVDLKVSEFAYC